MKNPFMLRSTHEDVIATLECTIAEQQETLGIRRDQIGLMNEQVVKMSDEIERLNGLLARTVAPEPDEPTDDQAKLIKSLEEELETIEQTIKLTEDERVVVMKGRRRKTRELTDLIKRRTEVADKLAKAKAPQVEQAVAA